MNHKTKVLTAAFAMVGLLALGSNVHAQVGATISNTAGGISNKAKQWGNDASAKYHELRTNDLVEDARDSNTARQAAESAQKAVEHKSQELENRAAAERNKAAAATNFDKAAADASRTLSNATAATKQTYSNVKNKAAQVVSNTFATSGTSR